MSRTTEPTIDGGGVRRGVAAGLTGENFESDEAEKPHVYRWGPVDAFGSLFERLSDFGTCPSPGIRWTGGGADGCRLRKVDEFPGAITSAPDDVTRMELTVDDSLTMDVLECLQNLNTHTRSIAAPSI